MSRRIPFHRPSFAGSELAYVAEALQGDHWAGDGPFSRRCHALLEGLLGVEKVLLTTSGTHALELAALLLDLEPGDEVILPAFTFTSTANAFVLRGARPVFADVRPDTLNLDERRLDALITPRTAAIVPVHYAGIACEMDSIMATSERHGVPVVEDNAHGLFGSYRGRRLGTFGALAAHSFHESKNLSCGEGGALAINDPSLVARAEVLREKGTDRTRFFRGEIDKYTWVDVGSSFLLAEPLAAILLAQLEAHEGMQQRRRAVWDRYVSELAGWAAETGVCLPTVPAGCVPAYHLFYLLLPSPTARDGFMGHLRRRGISAFFHYQPLHLSAMGRRLGGRPGDCPVTESISGRLVRLPLHHRLQDDEVDDIVAAAREYTAAASLPG